MLAVSRTITGERLVAFEFLRIVERDGGLVYIAQPNGRPPSEFVLTAIDANAATFENPAHDFPKMIRYTRREDGGLEARVSGSNGERAQSFVFTRLPCDPTLKLAMRASRASEPPACQTQPSTGDRGPASAKATAARRSFSEGGGTKSPGPIR